MRLFLFYSLFLVPFTTVLAQNNNASSPVVTVFTSVSTGVSVDQNHNTVLFTTAFNVTLTLTSGAPASTGNTTGNSTNNSNSTSTNSTSTKPTSTVPLPTAPTDVNGGGGGGGAPSPGQTGQGGVFGPPDGYVSGVSSLEWNAMVVSIAGVIIGTLFPLL